MSLMFGRSRPPICVVGGGHLRSPANSPCSTSPLGPVAVRTRHVIGCSIVALTMKTPRNPLRVTEMFVTFTSAEHGHAETVRRRTGMRDRRRVRQPRVHRVCRLQRGEPAHDDVREPDLLRLALLLPTARGGLRARRGRPRARAFGACARARRGSALRPLLRARPGGRARRPGRHRRVAHELLYRSSLDGAAPSRAARLRDPRPRVRRDRGAGRPIGYPGLEVVAATSWPGLLTRGGLSSQIPCSAVIAARESAARVRQQRCPPCARAARSRTPATARRPPRVRRTSDRERRSTRRRQRRSGLLRTVRLRSIFSRERSTLSAMRTTILRAPSRCPQFARTRGFPDSSAAVLYQDAAP